MIKIYIKTEFIKLSQFLKFSGLIDNGAESKKFIVDNEIWVDGILEKRRNKKLYKDSIVDINGKKYLIMREEIANNGQQ